MIVLRQICYSNRGMIDKLIEKLDKAKVEDYEVTKKIQRDVISVVPNQIAVKIYIPTEFEYSQYDIDDFIRSQKSHLRTATTRDRDVYVMKLSGSVSIDELVNIVRFIIETEDFCAIIEE